MTSGFTGDSGARANARSSPEIEGPMPPTPQRGTSQDPLPHPSSRLNTSATEAYMTTTTPI